LTCPLEKKIIYDYANARRPSGTRLLLGMCGRQRWRGLFLSTFRLAGNTDRVSVKNPDQRSGLLLLLPFLMKKKRKKRKKARLNWGHIPPNPWGPFIPVHSLRAVARVSATAGVPAMAGGIIWLFHVRRDL
jgi:hypothetical protein